MIIRLNESPLIKRLKNQLCLFCGKKGVSHTEFCHYNFVYSEHRVETSLPKLHSLCLKHSPTQTGWICEEHLYYKETNFDWKRTYEEFSKIEDTL